MYAVVLYRLHIQTKPLCTESAEVLCGTESPDPHSKMKSELSSSFLFL
jgi:hypothetical protein